MVCNESTSIQGEIIFSSTDQRYVVLGGQHISAAVRAVYEHYTEAKGYQDEDVPDVFKAVEAEILRRDIPLPLAALAAGLHQREQNATRETNTLDIIQMMCIQMKEKKAKNERVQLNDEELYLLLRQLSVPSVKKMRPRSSKPMPKGKKAAGSATGEVQESDMVCGP